MWTRITKTWLISSNHSTMPSILERISWRVWMKYQLLFLFTITSNGRVRIENSWTFFCRDLQKRRKRAWRRFEPTTYTYTATYVIILIKQRGNLTLPTTHRFLLLRLQPSYWLQFFYFSVLHGDTDRCDEFSIAINICSNLNTSFNLNT
jgi:hypothetical protein